MPATVFRIESRRVDRHVRIPVLEQRRAQDVPFLLIQMNNDTPFPPFL